LIPIVFIEFVLQEARDRLGREIAPAMAGHPGREGRIGFVPPHAGSKAAAGQPDSTDSLISFRFPK
jgi:hypothetical protein